MPGLLDAAGVEIDRDVSIVPAERAPAVVIRPPPVNKQLFCGFFFLYFFRAEIVFFYL